jgi:hypothetical protein
MSLAEREGRQGRGAQGAAAYGVLAWRADQRT